MHQAGFDEDGRGQGCEYDNHPIRVYFNHVADSLELSWVHH